MDRRQIFPAVLQVTITVILVVAFQRFVPLETQGYVIAGAGLFVVASLAMRGQREYKKDLEQGAKKSAESSE